MIHHSLRRILAPLFALGAIPLASCTATAGADLATVAEVRPADAVAGPALWELRDEDTTIYLFGTVHVLPEGVEWYDARIARAFASADELVTEVDTRDAAAMNSQIAASAMLAPGQNLRELMTPENRTEYEAALVSLGLPPATLDQFEPWFAALNLSVLPLLGAGYQPDAGVEMQLNARAEGKEHGALETMQQQVELFDGMDLPYQLEYLDNTVEGVDDVVPMVNQMVAEWLDGDAAGLADLLNGEIDDSYLYDRLLVNRNANWTSWIQQRMAQPGTVFIAVGAGHLAGQGSVQQQLMARGFTVTRVWR